MSVVVPLDIFKTPSTQVPPIDTHVFIVGFWSTILVPSYTNVYTCHAVILLSAGSVPSISFIFLAPRVFRFKLQAPVFAVVKLTLTIMPVVYAVSAGVREARYVSDPVVEAVYVKAELCVFFAISREVTNKSAHVDPTTVPVILCHEVASCTFPATVGLAFGCVLPLDIVTHAPPCLI